MELKITIQNIISRQNVKESKKNVKKEAKRLKKAK